MGEYERRSNDLPLSIRMHQSIKDALETSLQLQSSKTSLCDEKDKTSSGWST